MKRWPAPLMMTLDFPSGCFSCLRSFRNRGESLTFSPPLSKPSTLSWQCVVGSVPPWRRLDVLEVRRRGRNENKDPQEARDLTRQVESGLPHSLTEHLLMCPEHRVGEGTGHRHDHRAPWSGGHACHQWCHQHGFKHDGCKTVGRMA